MANKECYTSNEVAGISGVSLRQLQWWDEQRVVCPRHTGHRREYTPDEALRVSILAELRRKGMSLQQIRRILKKLGQISGGQYLLTDGKLVQVETSSLAALARVVEAKNPLLVVAIAPHAQKFCALAS